MDKNITPPTSPTTPSAEFTVDKLAQWMDNIESFFNNIYDAEGKIDYAKALHVSHYTLGRVYSLLNRNLMQQKNILAEMESKLATLRWEALAQFKTKVPYDLDSKGVETYLSAHPSVCAQNVQIKMQKNLVEYIEHLFSQASYYAGNLKNIIDSQMKVKMEGF